MASAGEEPRPGADVSGLTRRGALALLSAAALAPARPARAGALLDETVGFAAQVLFLALKPPALVLGVVRDGETSIHGFGRRADGSDGEPDGASLFRIGSITKAFAGQVLASLAADRIVGLADPLARHVPAFAQAASPDRPIRLIDLATHSAGLPREVPHPPGPADDPFQPITHAAFAAWLAANPLLFPPGSAALYSNFGFDLLAAALAAAAGKPYPELLAERVLKPLGLGDTAFAPPAGAAARRMQGHGFDGAPLPFVPTGDVIVGSGGLYSSARDLLGWLGWHLDRFGAARADERLIDHAAWLPRDGLTSVVGLDESGHMDAMGLGWVIMAPQGDRPLILQKAGGLQGTFSYVAFAPTRKVGVAIAINAFDVNAALAMAKAANDLIVELGPR